MSCSICTEKFNRTLHKAVKCPVPTCLQDVCLECCKTYAISAGAPKCCTCNAVWTDEFSRSVFPLSFYNAKAMRTAREAQFLDRETARLAEAQTALVAKRKRKELEKEVGVLSREEQSLHARKRRIQDEIAELRQVQRTGRQPGQDGNEPARPSAQKKCPVPNCNGFITPSWRCGLCEQSVCQHCWALIPSGSACEGQCDAEALASADLIRSQCRDCPKCAAAIFRIDGKFGIGDWGHSCPQTPSQKRRGCLSVWGTQPSPKPPRTNEMIEFVFIGDGVLL